MIALKVSYAFFNNVIIHGLGFVSLFFVARYMGPEALGIVAFAIAYLGIFQNFSDLGFGAAHGKRISEGKDLGTCNGVYFSIKILLTFIMVVIVLATILFAKYVQNKHFISEQHEIVLYIILLSTAIGNVSMMFIITFGARKEIAKQQMPLLIQKIIEVVSKVLVAISGLGVVLLACTNLLGAATALVLYVILFRGYPLRKPTSKYFRSYASFALPVLLIGFLSSIAHNMDKVMTQFFWTTADVGYYSAAQRISMVLNFVNTASITLIFPTISKYHSNSDFVSIRRLSRDAERYLSMALFPVVIFISCFSQQICNIILGSAFLTSAPILVILSWVVLVDGISQPYTQQIGGTNHIVLAARLSGFIFLLDVVLNLVFIPRQLFGLRLLGLGAIGAALSTLISISVGAVVFRFYAYRITATKPNLRVYLHLLAALIMGGILRGVSVLWRSPSFFSIVFYFVIGMVIYLLVLRLLGEFTQNDSRLFRKILNPRQLRNYALSEISSKYSDKRTQSR